MWHLPLLFPAVDLGQATRWSELIYCNHLVLMTVFVQGLWLNTSFIQLWLSLAQHSLLMKHKLAQCLSCIFCWGFLPFLLPFFQPVFTLSLSALIPHRSWILANTMVSTNMVDVTTQWIICSVTASLHQMYWYPVSVQAPNHSVEKYQPNHSVDVSFVKKWHD